MIPFRAVLGLLLLVGVGTGCSKPASRTWTPGATLTGSGSSATSPVPLSGWLRFRYTFSEPQTAPVKIFLSERGATAGSIPTLFTVDTHSADQSGSVEQQVTEGDYSVFTSAVGRWQIAIDTGK